MMAFYGLRLEYALEGSSNYVAWKEWMEAVLEDNGLNKFIDNDVQKLVIDNTQNLAEWKKCASKVRRIILEGVQALIASNIHGKETSYAMWKALTYSFQKSSDHRKPKLKDKL